MVAPSSPPETIHDVVLLARQGMSRRAIARALKVSRNTVREILATHAQKRAKPHSVLETKPTLKRPSKLDEHRGKVDELLKTFPDITAQRIFEELKAVGFAGGYTGVKTLVRAVRPKPLATPSQETTVYGPGEMAENDWSPYRIAFTHAPHRILQGFSYALVNSHRDDQSVIVEWLDSSRVSGAHCCPPSASSFVGNPGRSGASRPRRKEWVE